MSWIIRVTFPSGKDAFLRHGGQIGSGSIATYHSKQKAEEAAAFLRQGMDAQTIVTVMARSHGRRKDGEARRAALRASCDHKFIDSTFCLKCGWTPPAVTREETR